MRKVLTEGRLLVVDDDARMRQSLTDLLAMHQCHPDVAGSGREAINQLRQAHYDAVLLDLSMPEVDGFGVMNFIQQEGIDTLVIVVSGESSFDAASQALKSGAYDYVKKPYAPEELLSTLTNALRKRKLLTENDSMQKQLVQSEQLHRFIVNHSPDIVFMLDDCGYINFINESVETLLHYPSEELVGRHISEIVEAEDEEKAKLFFRRVVVNGEQVASLDLCLKNNGHYSGRRHFEITVSPSHNSYDGIPNIGEGELVLYGSARDVTDRKEAEEFINFQAYHDLLTRLPNRVLFKDRLSVAISNAARHKQQFAVMFLDLDRFKVVNDSLGHSLGDRLLQAVAQRLQTCLRSGDTLSRFGGDEFTLLLPEVDSRESVDSIALKIVDRLKQSFVIDGHEIYIGCSIGIAMYPDAGEDMETLIQNADIAMYNAKGSGRDSHCIFSPDMGSSPAFRLSLERDIRRAISENELRLVYQPQVDSRTHQITGVEVLVRWQHPERGLMFPSEFIPVAEEIRLIQEVDKWVLRNACRMVKSWSSDGVPRVKLATNLSPLLVEQKDFVDSILAILEEENFPADMLELEITENVLLKDMDHITEKFHKLSAAGVHIALDDFGTGYSSLSYLHQFPIDTLKIDQSFVQTIKEQHDEACLVDAIVAMAKGLKMDIVAEGVETEQQLDYLTSLGCRNIQGWLFGKARSGAEIASELNSLGMATVALGRPQ